MRDQEAKQKRKTNEKSLMFYLFLINLFSFLSPLVFLLIRRQILILITFDVQLLLQFPLYYSIVCALAYFYDLFASINSILRSNVEIVSVPCLNDVWRESRMFDSIAENWRRRLGNKMAMMMSDDSGKNIFLRIFSFFTVTFSNKNNLLFHLNN